MDYEQFFTNTTDHKCDNQIRMTILVMTLVYVILDVTLMCKAKRRMNDMKKENETLKNVILKSVDRALMRMMKNGNDSEYEHED